MEVIDLILARMLHPENGLGIAQFAYDFTPLPAINFDTSWGRDADPEEGKPPSRSTRLHRGTTWSLHGCCCTLPMCWAFRGKSTLTSSARCATIAWRLVSTTNTAESMPMYPWTDPLN